MASKQSIAVEGKLLETSYGLVENDNISSKWRSMHCIFLIISAASGLVYYCLFSAVHEQLGGTCIVNIVLVFKKSNRDVIDDAASMWGNTSECDFCSYTNLVCSVLALIFLVYFIMSGKGGRGAAGFLAQPWRIVMATIFFSIIALSLSSASSWLTYFGRNSFCHQLQDRNLTFSQNATDDHRTSAAHLKLIKLAGCKSVYIENEEVTSSYDNHLFIAEVAGILNTVAWFAGFLVALFRILVLPDFRLVRFDFILEHTEKSRQNSPKHSPSSEGLLVHAEKVSLPGSVHSSSSALSTAQTALTSLDQQSLKQRESSEEDNP